MQDFSQLLLEFFLCLFILAGRSVTDSHLGICQVLYHKDSIPLVSSLSSRQSKLPPIYRASPPSLLPCISILKSLQPSIAALQLCEPSHHASVIQVCHSFPAAQRLPAAPVYCIGAERFALVTRLKPKQKPEGRRNVTTLGNMHSQLMPLLQMDFSGTIAGSCPRTSTIGASALQTADCGW